MRSMSKLCMGLVLTMTAPLSGAVAPHDLEVKLTALNVQSGQVVHPGPVKFTVTVKNKAGAIVSASSGYKIQVAKYDHTGQQYLKSVYTRDLPLLAPYPAPSGRIDTFTTPEFQDSAAQNDTGLTFIYRATIGPGYYTDAYNADNRSDIGVRFLSQTSTVTPLSWKRRLTPADFTRAGATLTDTQINKLNNNEYSLQSIVSSSTDRLFDNQKCSDCHTGQANQPVTKYRPELAQLPITKLMNHRPTRTSEIAGGYNWQNGGNNGAIGTFMNNGSKPDILKKIFKKWLDDGAR